MSEVALQLERPVPTWVDANGNTADELAGRVRYMAHDHLPLLGAAAAAEHRETE
jgi:hypothetical protein